MIKWRSNNSRHLKQAKDVANRIDTVFLLAVFLLAVYGTIMVFSAGDAYAYARYGDSLYFVKKQTIGLIIGIAVMYVAANIGPEIYEKWTPLLYASTIVLLILVLIIGFVGNGAQRWISIGPLTIQPSEIAKLTMIMMLAKYFSRYESLATDQKKRKNIFIFGTVIPFLIISICHAL